MAIEVSVTYMDGRQEQARLNARAMIEAERHFGGRMPRIEGALYAAWVRLGRQCGEFDAWADTVDEFEDRQADSPPPTPGD